MNNKFANLTRGEIAKKFISREQRDLLEEFFGAGLQGAKNRLANFIVSGKLKTEALEAYIEIACRIIEEKLDKNGCSSVTLAIPRFCFETRIQ